MCSLSRWRSSPQSMGSSWFSQTTLCLSALHCSTAKVVHLHAQLCPGKGTQLLCNAVARAHEKLQATVEALPVFLHGVVEAVCPFTTVCGDCFPALSVMAPVEASRALLYVRCLYTDGPACAVQLTRTPLARIRGLVVEKVSCVCVEGHSSKNDQGPDCQRALGRQKVGRNCMECAEDGVHALPVLFPVSRELRCRVERLAPRALDLGAIVVGIGERRRVVSHA